MPDDALVFRTPDDGGGTLRLGIQDAAPAPGNALVFDTPASGSGRLVFGDAGGGEGPPPDGHLGIDADLPGLGSLTLGVGAGVGLDAALPGLDGSLMVSWDANVSRGGLRHELDAHWQQGTPVAMGARERWREAAGVRIGTQGRWQEAAPLHTFMAAAWRESDRLRSALAHHWQEGRRQRTAARQAWQEAERLRAAFGQRWQEAVPRRAANRSHWQDMLRLRAAVDHHWQDGRPARATATGRWQPALPVRIHLVPHWQEARRPPVGVSRIPVPPVRPPCYDPARLGLLAFDTPYSGDGKLVFVCHRAGPGPDPEPAQWVIPVLEVYMTTHSLAAVLLPSLEPVALLGASIESDDGGFGWSLQASGPEHLLDQLAPVGGLPARVRVTVDGHDWVFAIERIGRTRRHGQHRTSIQGRSITALLGEPYMPAQSWLNPLQITAQQAIVQALEYTGTTLDWGIDDWTLPAGTWSFAGTPLQAALRVAEAAGAVLRSHPTEQKLIVRPRYPVLPWEWGAAPFNVQIPADIITTDDLQPEPRAPYNAVYVTGMAGGVRGHVRRAGTAGDLLAPQVTDPLITQEVAARMRGSAELSAAGKKLMQTMTLPMLTDSWSPGPVLPGWLVHVDDIGHSWRGLVRSIRIDAGMPTVRQTVQVERVAA